MVGSDRSIFFCFFPLAPFDLEEKKKIPFGKEGKKITKKRKNGNDAGLFAIVNMHSNQIFFLLKSGSREIDLDQKRSEIT